MINKHRNKLIVYLILICLSIVCICYLSRLNAINSVLGVHTDIFDRVQIFYNFDSAENLSDYIVEAEFKDIKTDNRMLYSDSISPGILSQPYTAYFPDDKKEYDINIKVKNLKSGNIVCERQIYGYKYLRGATYCKVEAFLLFVFLLLLSFGFMSLFTVESKTDEKRRETLMGKIISPENFDNIVLNFYQFYHLPPAEIHFSKAENRCCGEYFADKKTVRIYNILNDDDRYSMFSLITLMHELGHHAQYEKNSILVLQSDLNMYEALALMLTGFALLLPMQWTDYCAYIVPCLVLYALFLGIYLLHKDSIAQLKVEKEASKYAYKYLKNIFSAEDLKLTGEDYVSCLRTYGLRGRYEF